MMRLVAQKRGERHSHSQVMERVLRGGGTRALVKSPQPAWASYEEVGPSSLSLRAGALGTGSLFSHYLQVAHLAHPHTQPNCHPPGREAGGGGPVCCLEEGGVLGAPHTYRVARLNGADGKRGVGRRAGPELKLYSAAPTPPPQALRNEVA